jgi:hypothetical protein
MMRCVGYIQEFTNPLRTFRISSLRPGGFLTPIGVDEPKAKDKGGLENLAQRSA